MEVQIRRGGSADDVNAIARINGEVFEPEYGMEPAFAADMAVQLAELRRSGWPRDGEGCWIAELDGRAVGSSRCGTSGTASRALGHLALRPEARGTGAGRRLFDTVLDAARAAGYQRLELMTFSDLVDAREIYSRARLRADGERAPGSLGPRARMERWRARPLACAR